MFYNSYLLSNILLYIPVVSILNWYIYPLAVRYLKQDMNVITTLWLLAMKVAYLYLSWLAAVIFILPLLPMLSSMVSSQFDGCVTWWPAWKKRLQSFETLHFKYTYSIVIFGVFASYSPFDWISRFFLSEYENQDFLTDREDIGSSPACGGVRIPHLFSCLYFVGFILSLLCVLYPILSVFLEFTASFK